MTDNPTESADTPKCAVCLMRAATKNAIRMQGTVTFPICDECAPAVETPTYGKVTCEACGAVERLTPTRATFDHPAGQSCSGDPEDICDCHMTLGMYGERAVETPTEPMTDEWHEPDCALNLNPVEYGHDCDCRAGRLQQRIKELEGERVLTWPNGAPLSQGNVDGLFARIDTLQSALTAAEKERDAERKLRQSEEKYLASANACVSELEGTVGALEGRLADWQESARRALLQPCDDEKHCTCVPAIVAAMKEIVAEHDECASAKNWLRAQRDTAEEKLRDTQSSLHAAEDGDTHIVAAERDALRAEVEQLRGERDRLLDDHEALRTRTEKMAQALREIAEKLAYYAPIQPPHNGSWLDDLIAVAGIAREALKEGE